jgi:hypothetical protein
MSLKYVNHLLQLDILAASKFLRMYMVLNWTPLSLYICDVFLDKFLDM